MNLIKNRNQRRKSAFFLFLITLRFLKKFHNELIFFVMKEFRVFVSLKKILLYENESLIYLNFCLRRWKRIPVAFGGRILRRPFSSTVLFWVSHFEDAKIGFAVLFRCTVFLLYRLRPLVKRIYFSKFFFKLPIEKRAAIANAFFSLWMTEFKFPNLRLRISSTV